MNERKYTQYNASYPPIRWLLKLINRFLHIHNYPLKSQRLMVVSSVFEGNMTLGQLQQQMVFANPRYEEKHEEYNHWLVRDFIDKFLESNYISEQIKSGKPLGKYWFFKALNNVGSYLNKAKDFEDEYRFISSSTERKDRWRLIHPEEQANRMNEDEWQRFEMDRWFPVLTEDEKEHKRRIEKRRNKAVLNEEMLKNHPYLLALFKESQQIGKSIGKHGTEEERKVIRVNIGTREYARLDMLYQQMIGDINSLLRTTWIKPQNHSLKPVSQLEKSVEQMDFKNKEHVSVLIETYVELKQKYRENINSIIAMMLLDFKEWIRKIEFNDIERQVLIWKLEGYNNREIAEKMNVDARTVQRKLEKATVKITGFDPNRKYIFKTCSKCHEKKEITNHFHRLKNSEDGYRDICKECRKKPKKVKKYNQVHI